MLWEPLEQGRVIGALVKPFTPSSLYDIVAPAYAVGGSVQSIAKPTRKHFDGARVLVAEDNELNQMLIRELLEQRGVKVMLANNGEESLQLLREQPDSYDLVLMDMQMPEMDGLEATQLIKANWPQVKVIVLSMYAEYEAAAMAAGADAFVSKSDPPEKLRTMLEDVTRGDLR